MSQDSPLQLVNQLTEKITSGETFEEVFELIYQRLSPYVPYDRMALAVTDAGRKTLTMAAVRSNGTIILGNGYSASLAGSSLEGVIQEGRARILPDLEAYLANKPSSHSTRLMVEEGMRSSLTLPLMVTGRPIGVMFLSSRKTQTYQPDHEQFLRAIAGHMAIAIERTRLLDTLRARTEFLENILHNSVEAIIVVDRRNRIQSWNDGAVLIFGWTGDEAFGKTFEIITPPDLVQSGELERIRGIVEREGFIKDYETVRITKDGRRLTVNLTSTVLRDRRGQPIGRSAILRDVTRLRKLQEDLVRSQSLAAVGELAATVAHEIKNPLAGISGAIQVMGEAIPRDDPRRPVVGEILQQIRRLDNTVRDLLEYARPALPVRQPVPLAEMLTKAWSLLAPQPGASSIRFALDGADGVTLTVDPQLLHIVWMNLFQNAVEAMPHGGALSVSVRPADARTVCVAVGDTGSGVDVAHTAKLFRPFFSTKSRGTGLGLAITRKIVEAHDGRIRIESVPREGTTVFVELPR